MKYFAKYIPVVLIITLSSTAYAKQTKALKDILACHPLSQNVKPWIDNNKATIKEKIAEATVNISYKYRTLYETTKKLIISANITKEIVYRD
ncbi:MAG: hypothetical protein ACI87J_002107 [Colwellia sp.]|jgi:hypothetical protein